MLVLVTYDINIEDAAGKRRLRRVAEQCVNYGVRVQNSVFEANLDYGEFMKLKNELVQIIDEELDSLRFYYLGNDWHKKVEHIGAKGGYDPEGVIIV